MSHYQDLIRETLARQGKIGTDPYWVEAWMRVEHDTLDHLGGTDWDDEVRIATACTENTTPEENDKLAWSLMGPR
jgi:hypothetical protein